MPLTAAQSNDIVQAVRDVAAAEILPRFRNLGDGDIDAKAAFDDLVTVADKAAEDALTARIHTILPGDTVIGEEAVAEDRSLLDRVGQGRVTILDPIDGTWNYAHGIANYGVITAVIEDGVTVWGMLYDPSFDDWIVAARGAGSWFHRGGKSRRLSTLQDDTPYDRLRGNTGGWLGLLPERDAQRLGPRGGRSDPAGGGRRVASAGRQRIPSDHDRRPAFECPVRRHVAAACDHFQHRPG